MKVLRSLPLLALLLTSPALADEPPKTGTYTVTFTEQSPLTAKPELAKRFAKADLPTYDLSQEPFLVHVPDDYTAATPHGLIVLLNYKDSDQVPPLWPAVLAKHHLIYAMDTHHDHPEPAIAAISADAVYNLSKTYNIDPARIYVIGVNGAACTAITYSDVFTGGLFWGHLAYYRPLTVPKVKATYPAKMPRPQGASLARAKTRPYILGTRPDLDPTTATYQDLILKAFRQDGFRNIRTMTMTIDDFHYPGLTTEWLEETLAFFEPAAPSTQPAVSLATPPASTPSSAAHPTPSAPQRLLTLAQYFVNNKAYPAARQRLETIVKDYPNDPAAKDAQALLDSINKIDPPKVEWTNTTHGPRSE